MSDLASTAQYWHMDHFVTFNLVSSPDLIRRVYRLQYNAILKAICAGVGFGSETEITFNYKQKVNKHSNRKQGLIFMMPMFYQRNYTNIQQSVFRANTLLHFSQQAVSSCA